MKIKIEVEVAKELSELGDGVAKFLKVLKAEAMDGIDFTDIPSILSSAMADLVPALEGVEKIKDELTQDRSSFINAASVSGAKIINAVID